MVRYSLLLLLDVIKYSKTECSAADTMLNCYNYTPNLLTEKKHTNAVTADTFIFSFLAGFFSHWHWFV